MPRTQGAQNKTSENQKRSGKVAHTLNPGLPEVAEFLCAFEAS